MLRVCKICNVEKDINEFRCKLVKNKPSYEHNYKKCSYIRGKERVKNLKVSDPEKYKEIKTKQSNRDKNYYNNNKDRINQRNNNYYLNNRDNIVVQRKKYRSMHPEAIREQRKKFFAKRSNIIAQSLRRRIRSTIGTGKKAPELLGCSLNEFLGWLEFNFELDSSKEMSLENYGKWELDHVTPCSKFNLENENEKKKCFNWTNIAPLLATENRKKNNKIYDTHILRQELRVYLFKQIMDTASISSDIE